MTGEDRGTVTPFVEELGAKYPILCKAQSGSYSTGGVPSAYLVGANGAVLWQGHPAGLKDSDIEEHLKNVDKSHRVSTWAFTLEKQLPPMPEKLSGVTGMLVKLDFGAALKKVEGALATMEGDDKTQAEAVRDWIAKSGADRMEKAAGLARDGWVYKSALAYEEVEGLFKGHNLAKEAKDAGKALKAGKDTKEEFKASEKLEKIKKDMREEGKAEDKLACLKPLLAKKYAETRAGKEAAELAAQLEKGDKK